MQALMEIALAGPQGNGKATGNGVESLLPLLDEMKKFHDIEMFRLTKYLGSEQIVYLPVCCLRWTHDSINSQMVFGSGRREDGSIYELVHDLHSGRVGPDSVEPFVVVLDGRKLFSLTNRRLAAFKMFQALHQHEMVRVPCKLYHAQDERVKAKYKSAKTTSDSLCDGLGLLSCGPEAWHMGSPLFRTSQEWCKSTHETNLERQTVPPPERAAASDESWQASASQPPDLQPSDAIHTNSQHIPPEQDGFAIAPSQKSIHTGQHIQVDSNGKLYLAEVTQISESKKRGKAPIKVHYIGYGSDADEWVSLNCVRSKAREVLLAEHLPFTESCTSLGREVATQPNCELPVSFNTSSGNMSSPSTQKSSLNQSAPVSQSQLAQGLSHVPPASAANLDPGQASSQHTSCPRSESHKTSSTGPDSAYSLLAVGMQLQVVGKGVSYCAVVEEISQARERAEAPIKVHYLGRGVDSDEWVDLSRLRSKVLKGTLSNSKTLCGESTACQENHGKKECATDHDTEHHPATANHLSGNTTGNSSGAGSVGSREHVPALRHYSGLEPDCSDAEDYYSDTIHGSDDEEEDDTDKSSAGNGASGSNEYEHLADLERELVQTSSIKSLKKLEEVLVCGTFKVSSGQDAKNRRCRGEVMIERGPGPMLGCRVHIVGRVNRNGAWDFDRCWVRIVLARIARGPGESALASNSWNVCTAERTTLFGRVVRAEEYGIPRQMRVVGLRSNKVSSLTSLTFRAVNGKFPMIRVPWDSAKQLPSAFDLYIIDIVHWKGQQLPQGRIVEKLDMQVRSSTESIMYAVQVSLNFCDWEADITDDLKRPPNVCTNLKNFEPDALVVAIEEPGLPVSMAFSMPKGTECVDVHIIDVNAYLDMPGFEKVEDVIKRRSVGFWPMDHLDGPLDASLPFLPAGLQNTLGFQNCSTQAVLTFSFCMKGQSSKTSQYAKHFQNVVQCNKVLSFEEVGEVLADSKRLDGVSKLVRLLFQHVLTAENNAKTSCNSATIEHFEPDCNSGHSLPTIKDKQFFRRAAARLLAGYTYLVNRYAGSVLKDPQVWAPFLKPSTDSPAQTSTSKLEFPALVHGKPDPIIHNVLDRLMQRREFSGQSVIRVKDMIQASANFLSKSGLNSCQKHVLHAAFIRRARTAMPNSFYKLVDTLPWAPRANQSDTGNLFQRERTFQVCQPLRRYIDVLGLRALKCKLGWKPKSLQLSMSPACLAESLARTNARQDAHRFASYIFRQITLMNDVAKFGWQVEGAVVGPVGPVHFDVLIPKLVSNVLEIRIPVSALRSASCLVQYSPEKQMLDVICTNTKESSLSPWDRASWSIKPWSANDLSCVVARNFAHAVPNHASGSAVIASDITFLAVVGSKKVQVTLGLGHRMYPEMFSSLPDLNKWHLIDRDATTYSHIWSSIKECQIHASASSSPSYTPPVPALRLRWFSVEGGSCYKCFVRSEYAGFADSWIAKGDLAVLRCIFKQKATVLHGLVKGVSSNAVKLPVNPHGRDQQPQTEVFEVEVSLSQVSEIARAWQRQFLENASDDSFTLQFINVQPAEKKILELVHAVPKTISASPFSPIAKYLTLLQAPRHKKWELEKKPLASVRQVESAMQEPHFHMRGGSALNEQQVDGIKKGLQRSLSLVQGPPGTGKTTFLVHLIVSLLNLETDGTMGARDYKHLSQKGKKQQQRRPGKILICTPSNHAADEIIDRVLQKTDIPHHYITRVYARSIESGHGCKYRGGAQWNTNSDLKFNIRAGLEEHSLHFKTQSLRDVWPLHDSLRTDVYDAVAQRSFDDAYSRGEPSVLNQSRIVVTTCSSALLHTALNKYSRGRVWRPVKFETVVIDEAAQASEPDVVLPALLAESRVVIVGDHKQLGPVIPEKNLCKAYVKALETPFVERILEASSRQAPTSTKLNVQYRMHPSIRSFPSKQFYESSLKDASTMISQPLLQCIWPNNKEHVVFLDCRHPHSYGLRVEDGRRYSNAATLVQNGTSLKNPGEVKLVVEAYDRLLKYGMCTASEIAIITPYRAQQEEIREKLENRVGEVAKKTVIGTVHAVQGSERDYVIISFVRSTSEEMQKNSLASPDDIIHSVNKNSLNLRQLCESNLGIVSDEKLLNVSLTRAKHGLVCVGNREVLSQASKDFFNLSEHYAAAGCMLTNEQFMSLGLPKGSRSHGKKGYRVPRR